MGRKFEQKRKAKWVKKKKIGQGLAMTLLNPDTVILFSPFGCIYQPTSPCPTLSAHTKPISHGHCWKLVTSQIV